MKGKPKSSRPYWTSNDGRVESGDAETVAIRLLGALANSPERLGRFLALTGISPESLREVASSPDFLGAVLDHVVADERLLIELAGETGIQPDTIAAAAASMAGRDRRFVE